jgi:hypothetical protein
LRVRRSAVCLNPQVCMYVCMYVQNVCAYVCKCQKFWSLRCICADRLCVLALRYVCMYVPIVSVCKSQRYTYMYTYMYIHTYIQGDAPTSGRVFEALPSGCIPLISSPVETMRTDLPFPSLIDWDSIALFTPNVPNITTTAGNILVIILFCMYVCMYVYMYVYRSPFPLPDRLGQHRAIHTQFPEHNDNGR